MPGFGSQYVGNPTNVQAPDTAPAVNKAPSIYLPSDLDGATWANLFQALKDLADNIAFINTNASFLRTAFIGGGFDGSATLDGVATVSWASKVGSVYTLTQNVSLTNLTIANGVSLIGAGFYLNWNGLLWVQTGGKLAHDGSAGSGASGGFSASVGSLSSYLSGFGTGANGATGTGGNASSPTDGGISPGATIGVGGNGGAGGTGGGGSGATSNQGKTRGAHYNFPFYPFIHYTSSGSVAGPIGLVGGVGGGGGGGDGTNSGGGGGGGGGQLILVGNQLQIDGTIECIGGAGANGVAGNAGGGGGGSGGVIRVARSTRTGSGGFSVAGGAAGSGVGTGSAGTAGKAGLVVEVQL